MVSIRTLNVSLVFASITITALVCTLVAVTSGDQAIDDTKKSRDTSISQCFDTGSASVTNLTNDFLVALILDAKGQILSYLNPMRYQAGIMANQMQNPDPVHPTISTILQSLRSSWWSSFDRMWLQGCTGIVGITPQGETLRYFEDSFTIKRGPDEFHSMQMMYSTGTGTIITSSIPFSGSPPNTELEVYPNCPRTAIATNGSQYDGLCWIPSALYNPFDDFRPFFPFITPGPDGVRWSHPLNVAGGYMASLAIGTFSRGALARAGVVAVGIDLAMISGFLRSIDLGSSKARIYTNIRSSWSMQEEGNPMTGASHGEVTRLVDQMTGSRNAVLELLDPRNSSDSTIRSTAQFIADFRAGDLEGYAAMDAQTAVTSLFLDEEYYTRTVALEDGHGIDWYVNIVTDRAHLLGAVDAAVAQTQSNLRESEMRVDDNLQQARTILYIIVVVTALCLIIGAVVFVIAITHPLLVLGSEMESVALMRLETVDKERKPSSLAEVGSMQKSFLQMVYNLQEYRNYMPMSALQTEGDSTEEDTSTLSASGSKLEANKRRSVSEGRSVGSTIAPNQTPAALQSMQLRSKKATLASLNCKGFLDLLSDLDTLQRVHTTYLSLVLKLASQNAGVPDTFSGDRITLSWNTVRSCSQHAMNGTKFSFRMLSSFQDLEITAGVASGDIRCGNMGVNGMKKYTNLGGVASFVPWLERINMQLETHLLVCPTVAESIKIGFQVRAIECVFFRKYSQRDFLIFEPTVEKEIREQEWMYQLQEGETSDTNTSYNKAFALYAQNSFEKALSVLGDNATESTLYRKLEAARSAGRKTALDFVRFNS